MVGVTTDAATPAGIDLRFWALLFGNFVIGTGILLPAGMLEPLAGDLGVSVSVAGWLMLVGGVTIGIAAPLVAAFTSAIDRRLLLLASLALYAAGHAASVFAPNFATLLILRVATVVAAGIFTPQAASTVGLLAPPERRSAGVAFIFLGWSVSLVSGTALAGLIATYLGWRVGYMLMAALSVLAFGLVAWTIPRGLKVAPLSLASWGKVLGNPKLVLIILVTVASSSGQFGLLTYIQPVLKALYHTGPDQSAAILTVFGVFGIMGNLAGSRLVVAWGAERLIFGALISMTASFLVLALTPGLLAAATCAAALWGLGTFSSNSLQQARLMGRAPPLASASVALNTSAIYIGQAIGPGIGGSLIAFGHIGWVPVPAAILLALAAALSALAR